MKTKCDNCAALLENAARLVQENEDLKEELSSLKSKCQSIPFDEEELDAATPEEIPLALLEFANKFEQSQSELQSAWQDEDAGQVWRAFAVILRRAARSCEIAIAKYV